MTVHRQVVAGLIRRNDEVLLVYQQGPRDPRSVWSLPGGVVEPGELLPVALAREIREETGLVIGEPGVLLYVTQWHRVTGEIWTAFVFDLGDCDGDLVCQDPDALITEAAFVPLSDAIERLLAQPFRVMSEPIVAFLSDEIGPGAVWCYRQRENGPDELVLRLDGSKFPVPDENPFDVLGKHAEAEYRAGRTRNLRAFAAEYGLSLEEPSEANGSPITGDVAR